MTRKELIVREIEQVPETLLNQVLEFVRLLKARADNSFGVTALSESSLKKDWLRPEEDEAWQDL